jgi:lipopolysaccharide export system protein LptC
MSRIKIILIVVLLITLFLVGLFFFLFGVNIPYKLRFNKDNPDYRLEKIDINEHRTQSYD